MKKLSMSGQKLLKAVHLVAVGLWLSCVIVLLVMPVITRHIVTGEELYMYNSIYHFIDMYILTPAAIATLVTGTVYSLFTKWGFFKHGWLVYKWGSDTCNNHIGNFLSGADGNKDVGYY